MLVKATSGTVAALRFANPFILVAGAAASLLLSSCDLGFLGGPGTPQHLERQEMDEDELLAQITDTRPWTLGEATLAIAPDASAIEIRQGAQSRRVEAGEGYYFSDPTVAVEARALFVFRNWGSATEGVASREIWRISAPPNSPIDAWRTDTVMVESDLEALREGANCSSLYGASPNGQRLLIEINAPDSEWDATRGVRYATWPYFYYVADRRLEAVAP